MTVHPFRKQKQLGFCHTQAMTNKLLVSSSSEQVVPLSSSETDHFMEADLPDENGAASVKAAVIQVRWYL